MDSSRKSRWTKTMSNEQKYILILRKKDKKKIYENIRVITVGWIFQELLRKAIWPVYLPTGISFLLNMKTADLHNVIMIVPKKSKECMKSKTIWKYELLYSKLNLILFQYSAIDWNCTLKCPPKSKLLNIWTCQGVFRLLR